MAIYELRTYQVTVGKMAEVTNLYKTLGWPALEAHGQDPHAESVVGPVFLKGNQHSGQFLLRAEAGLGEGILISGHLDGEPDPALEGTWGPLPLDLFNA